MLGVVTGLKSEARLLRGLDLPCISTGGRAHVAGARIERLLDRGVRGLVSFGIAGALSPDLKAGDLVVADKVLADGGEAWSTYQPWIDALLWSAAEPRPDAGPDDAPHPAAARRSDGRSEATPARPVDPEHARIAPDAPPVAAGLSLDPSWQLPYAADPAHRRDDRSGRISVGAILGLDGLLSSPQQKGEMHARSGALAVDMESHHVARAAARRGLPFIAIRAIADAADEALPPVMAGFVDAEGRTRTSAVLAALVLGRISVTELVATARASRRAHRALFRCRRALAGLG